MARRAASIAVVFLFLTACEQILPAARMGPLVERHGGNGGRSFTCPDLIAPGHHPRRAMRPAVRSYLHSRRLEGTRGYSYRVTRMEHRVLGGPEAECSRASWRRSFQVEGHFHYVGSPKNASSSLSYFRVLVGRTRGGWTVWAEPH